MLSILITKLAIKIISSSDRILGMLPITFVCLIIPIIVQILILTLWALKWKSPEEED
jgi:hypothetical protein